MSKLSDDCSRHDLFLGLAIRNLRRKFPLLTLISSDGSLPFEDCIAERPTNIFGYIPDAILSDGNNSWIVESKSYEDLFSLHTRKQFENWQRVAPYLNSSIYLFVFDVPKGASLPEFIFSFENIIFEIVEIGS